MTWSPNTRPRLRPLESFPVPEGNGMMVGLRDPSGLSGVALALSRAALGILSLMDGNHTCQDICAEYAAATGQTLPDGTLQSMLDSLEQAHFLEGTEFETYYAGLVADYRSQPTRAVLEGSALEILHKSPALFDEILAEATQAPPTTPLVGLIAPHLDYPRGRPAYAEAYAMLRNRPAPDRVVILGTNHFGRSPSIVATAANFATPLGITRTDTDFLNRLEERCGNLREHELDHLHEHSVELQVAWLQHLFGPDTFELVAVLCPNPDGFTKDESATGSGGDLSLLATTLAEFIAEDRADTLLVAGADLSHTGAAFGDEHVLEPGYLEEIQQRDQRALDRLIKRDPAGWVRCVAEDGNPTNVCSAGCIYALSSALPTATVRQLRYHQAVDHPTQTCVTCAAVAFS